MKDGTECKSGQWVTFGCFTMINGIDERKFQSRTCEDAERAHLAARVAELEERAHLAARVAELEARCKRLEEAARAVYLDSIASDHPWSANETRNMHALRDVLEAKP